jgi:predicted nucleic acid-binding protein
MIVISNASPLVALSRIARLDIFQQMFGSLLIPPAVKQEVVTDCLHVDEKTYLEQALNSFIHTRKPTHNQVFSRNIGAGERGVLNLALGMPPDVLLLDDRKARNEARELGFTPTFTSDILKEAEFQGIIPSYQEILNVLYAQRIYLPGA